MTDKKKTTKKSVVLTIDAEIFDYYTKESNRLGMTRNSVFQWILARYKEKAF